jgi:hypothetical protein
VAVDDVATADLTEVLKGMSNQKPVSTTTLSFVCLQVSMQYSMLLRLCREKHPLMTR